MASNPTRRCTIPGCSTVISPRSRLDECPACRAYLVTYLKARPAKVMERRQKIHLYDSRLQVIMPGDPEGLTEATKLVAPSNYKPQSKKGRAVAKQTPRRRAQQLSTNRGAIHA
jgi:hypothetical protein